jgi:N-methylhydantoinase A/oxoprolinase/acetone carboxylase beta subunit
LRRRANLATVRATEYGELSTVAERSVYFKGMQRAVACPVWRRGALQPGARIAGPAIIEEPSSTTVLDPGDEMEVNPFGHMVIHVGREP